MPDDLVYRVRCVSQGWGGAPGLNTFYFGQDDGIESDHAVAALDVVTRVRAAIFGIGPVMTSAWTCQVQGVVDVINTDNSDLVESLVVAAPAVVAGTFSGAFGPQAAMVCANLVTSDILDGRRIRGRAFIGPVANNGDGDGTPSAEMVTDVGGALTGLMGGGAGAVPLVVWSRRRPVSAEHPTGLGGSAHIVTAVTVKDTFAILRSRRQ